MLCIIFYTTYSLVAGLLMWFPQHVGDVDAEKGDFC